MNNVIKLAPTTLCNTQQDVVTNLRRFANDVESGLEGDVRTIIVVIETMDGKLGHNTIGASCDLARAVGLLTIEALRSATDDV